MFIVRASLTLSDGTRLKGYLTPPIQGETGLSTLQPAVVVPSGPTHIAKSYALLGKASPARVFPLRFETDVDLVGGPIPGDVPGFLILEDFKTRRIRVIT